MMRTLLAKVVCDEIASGKSVSEAAAAAVARCATQVDHPWIATIVIDAEGNYGAAQTTPKLAHAWIDDDSTIHTSMVSG
jgi:isoaspartyl peptidase/L-asparaginase-like protein (Ntn-hydrolase superfamily)